MIVPNPGDEEYAFIKSESMAGKIGVMLEKVIQS